MIVSKWHGVVGMLVVVTLGCGGPQSSPPAGPTANAVRAAEEPAGGVGVGEARTASKDGDEVVVVGRIGGSAKPFVSGLAAFTIVDVKVPHCGADEDCPTPWDYCCETNAVKDNIATIRLVGEDGKLLQGDAAQLLGTKELAVVVAKGKAIRGADGSLSVSARQVFVRE